MHLPGVAPEVEGGIKVNFLFFMKYFCSSCFKGNAAALTAEFEKAGARA